MKKVISFVFFLLSVQLVAQDADLSGFHISNITTTTIAKGIQVKFDYTYLDHFPDSLSFATTAKLKTTDHREVALSRPAYFMKRPKSTRTGDRTIIIPFREIELNEGTHQLRIELEAYYKESYKQLLGSSNYTVQQPRRYEMTINLSGGQVTPLNSSSQTWDPSRLFSNKKEHRLPDPQWWVYIGSSFYMHEPSEPNINDLQAPSASFRIILMQFEKVYVKLYDKDDFINRDDLIGTYRIVHPAESMNQALNNQNAENVSGFDVQMTKQLYRVSY